MARLVILYAIALALAVAGLEWLEYRFPVGLLVSLVSALLLRNPKLLPATRA